MERIDEKDMIILAQLRKNAKLSSRALAKRVGLPISTVYRRIRKMEDAGVITGYHVEVDFDKVGKPVGILVMINLAEGREFIPIDKIKQELRRMGEILELMTVHGGNFDLLARVRLASLKTITPFLERVRNIEGIEEVSCVLVSEKLV